MGHEIGSLSWARRTGGVLSGAESRALLVELLAAQLTLIPEEWLHRLGMRRARDPGLDVRSLTPPDSKLAREAAATCREVSPEYLYNHCARSYLWGRLFAAQLGLTLDPELLYLAAMYHDMGLTESLGGGTDRPACFSLIGAEAARAAMTPQEEDGRRVDTVCEAITLHLNINVDPSYGAEAQVLNLATALDTTGLRLWRMPREVTAAVLEQYPRCNQNALICACWQSEAARHPGARAAWLEQKVGFSRRLRRSPLG